MLSRGIHHMRQAGSSLIEILVTIVILAFGLLGLAGFLMQVQTTELESYQRAQALNLLNDMVERISINKANASTYVTTEIGTSSTGGTTLADCSASAIGTAARDLCEWSNILKGSAEVKAGANIGAMEGARGCITEVQAPNTAASLCLPGIYQVSVAWQGRNQTVAPATSLTCGNGLYGNEKSRRVIAQAVTVALLTCN